MPFFPSPLLPHVELGLDFFAASPSISLPAFHLHSPLCVQEASRLISFPLPFTLHLIINSLYLHNAMETKSTLCISAPTPPRLPPTPRCPPSLPQPPPTSLFTPLLTHDPSVPVSAEQRAGGAAAARAVCCFYLMCFYFHVIFSQIGRASCRERV